jgi:APA family basic amino acid/polyamine antiporter
VVSGIGALNGWTLIVTETSRAIAQGRPLPRPFAWTDRKGTAWFGILVGTALPSLLMLWRYNTSAGLTVFTYLVDLTVVTVAIPYFFSALAQLTYLVSRRRRVQGWQLARDLSVAGASVLFSLWVTFASGYQVVYQALVVILAGLILYAFLNARRQRLGETAEPTDFAAEASAAELSRIEVSRSLLSNSRHPTAQTGAFNDVSS